MEQVKEVLKQYWGYDSFRPLQQEAMEATCCGRDTVLVLPTGGGKSLCFQVPAVIRSGLTVVVSPLISLMKDQVDALSECGIPAARIDSSLTPDERNSVFARIHNQQLKLLYVAPERLVMEGFVNLLREHELSQIAVDEAHCISMWGHDFRPEYRQLGTLKTRFPGIPIGAYTATATEQVRADICKQMHLDNPSILVGSFDRPNLVYSVNQRSNAVKQVCDVIDRHKGESGIVYCIRRNDVDSLCAALTTKGYPVAPYHAGMSDEDRKQNQDRFIKEETDIIVATIAFGMGIDKSNVRYVVHTGMPKSPENYQQESGRAGRDGLEAECVLLYSGGDYAIWKHFTREMSPEAQQIAMAKLTQIASYCNNGLCRHRALVNYFGQDYERENCGACDICLGLVAMIDEPLQTAQKILSCVLRLEQQFGAGYTAQVLTGSRDARLLENHHDALSTYGLLQDRPQRTVLDWTEQLVGQGYLLRAGEFNVLQVTPAGWQVLRGDITPRLFKPMRRAETKKIKLAQVTQDAWEGVDQGLFEALRKVRASLATKRGVPAYVVFGDAALRDMARRRPSDPDQFLEVKGVGERKRKQYGKTMLTAIKAYCDMNDLALDVQSV